jgi:hypothetical protein
MNIFLIIHQNHGTVEKTLLIYLTFFYDSTSSFKQLLQANMNLTLFKIVVKIQWQHTCDKLGI